MSIHRSLCIPLPLGRLSQRISRISTHSSRALYPGFSPTTLGPTISSGTHRYAVASPSEVGCVGGWRGAREVAPTRVTPRRASFAACRLAVSYRPRIVLWRSPESPLAYSKAFRVIAFRILRRSVVVATKVPNPGQRLPNSRQYCRTGFLPLALVWAHPAINDHSPP
jgi:hypothetical protein